MTYQPSTSSFVCKDCGADVYIAYRLAANEQELCLVCLWLRGIEDPVERQKLRERLTGEKDEPVP